MTIENLSKLWFQKFSIIKPLPSRPLRMSVGLLLMKYLVLDVKLIMAKTICEAALTLQTGYYS